MTSNYVERSGTGGLQTAIITNDDEFLLDIEDPVTDERDLSPGKILAPRSY